MKTTGSRWLTVPAIVFLLALPQYVVSAETVDDLLNQAKAAEWASRAHEAIGLYKRVMESPGARELAVVEATERYLLLRGRSMDSAELVALKEDVCKRLTGPTARGQVTIAVARRLIRIGNPTQARNLLDKLPEREIPKGYKQELQTWVGDELLRLAAIAHTAGRPAAEVARYEQLLSDDRYISQPQRGRARRDLVLRLIAAGEIGRSEALVKQWLDQADSASEQGEIQQLQINVLMAKGDAESAASARKLAEELVRNPEVSQWSKRQLAKRFGLALTEEPGPSASELDDAQVAQRIHELEEIRTEEKDPGKRGPLCRDIIRLVKRQKGPQVAQERAQEFLKQAGTSAERQLIFRELYGLQVESQDWSAAVVTARQMLGEVATEGAVYPEVRVRELAAEVFMDFLKNSQGRGTIRQARDLMVELDKFGKRDGLGPAVREWWVETNLRAYQYLGDLTGGLAFFRQNGGTLDVVPQGLAGLSLAGTKVADKAELSAGQALTMGVPKSTGSSGDLLFAIRWYFVTTLDTEALPGNSLDYRNAFENACRKEGRPADAARFVEEVAQGMLEEMPEAPAWRYRAAELYIEAKELGGARKALQELGQRWPAWRPKSEFLLAQIETDLPAATQRLGALHASIDKTSTMWLESGRKLAGLLDQQGQWEKALELRLEMGKRHPDQIEPWASAKWQAKRYEDALTLYLLLRELRPDDHEAYKGQARCLTSLGRAEEALKVCQEAIDRFPQGKKQSWASISAAYVCISSLDRYQEAQELCEKFLATYPKDEQAPAARSLLVQALNGRLRTEGDKQVADELRLKLVKLRLAEGKADQALKMLGEIGWNQGWDEGDAPAGIRLLYARAYAAKGDAVKAIGIANRVLTEHANDKEASKAAEELIKELE